MGRKRITIDGQQYYAYRVQVETAIGRELKTGEHIHHLDGDVENDNWENLALMSKGTHWILGRLNKALEKITLFDPRSGQPFHPVGFRFVLYREDMPSKEVE